MTFGLLGRKLGHSYSPQIHSYLADYSYVLFEKEPEELNTFFANPVFQGINVTIPYKKTVIPYCAELSERARMLGAVNTIVRRSDGTLIGHNTDHFGFTYMVKQSGLQVCGKKALVLGSGGASVTAVAVLKEMGAQVIVISRNGDDNYSNLERHSDAAVIVNATPVGMYPNTGVAPLDLSIFPSLEGVLDMIYNPARTKLLLDAEAKGIVAENGLWMLIAQAKESAEWFLGDLIPDEIILMIYRKLRRQMEKIVLVGMPGCGKSHIGKLLAHILCKDFVDADAVVTELAGKSIPDIFAEYGEETFRAWETKALAQLGKASGTVIATGGGCVTRQENYPLLHQNSTIVWLQRELDDLPMDGRPLSQAGKLETMYQVRRPLYERFADLTVVNDTTPEAVAQKVCQLLTEEVNQ